MNIYRHPIEWYAKLISVEFSFSLLMYGDGEFMVASGEHIGKTLAFGEVCTKQLSEEMARSFDYDSQNISNPAVFRASDPFLLDPNTYTGRDIEMVRAVHRKALPWISREENWYDGVVWDVASREGGLNPFLRVIWQKEVILIGHRKLADCNVLRQKFFVPVPETNAAADLDRTEEACMPLLRPGRVVIICTGLGAIPLAMRLRRHCPEASYLDLGSVFDVFARLGEQRGWRQEMYRDEARWKECVRKNLEGT